LRVELYVFGLGRAEATHFKVMRCAQPAYPATNGNWAISSPETPNIAHPLLRQWVAGAAVATKLTTTLSPADMRQDVWLDWKPFQETRDRVFSRQGAQRYALNWGAAVLAVGLVVAGGALTDRETLRRRLFKISVGTCALGVLLAVGIYVLLPKAEAVRTVSRPGHRARQHLDALVRQGLGNERASQADLTLAGARSMFASLTNSMSTQNPGRRGYQWWDNVLLGGTIHEEDSPGNYTLRETSKGVDYVTYDAQGAEHVYWSLPLR
jgi:hypothetical protein